MSLAVAFAADHVFVHLMMIYLFLSMLMDIGCLLLEVQGFSPLVAFANPIFDTRSPRDFWGKKMELTGDDDVEAMCLHPTAQVCGRTRLHRRHLDLHRLRSLP